MCLFLPLLFLFLASACPPSPCAPFSSSLPLYLSLSLYLCLYLSATPLRLQAGVELICQDQKGAGVTGDSCFSKINSQRRSKYSPLTLERRHAHTPTCLCTKARQAIHLATNGNVRLMVLAPCQLRKRCNIQIRGGSWLFSKLNCQRIALNLDRRLESGD